MNKKKLILIDSMGIIHRAFHAYPGLTTSDGQLVNALYGFGIMFIQILKNLKPDYVIFATDLSKKTFRSEKFTEYKAQRGDMDEGLKSQIPLIYDLISSTGLPIYSQEGYEADDIIGSIAYKYKDDFDIQIVTGDKDLLQLINDDISVVLPGKTFSDMRIYNESEFIERFGFKPSEYIDYKALVGDQSDNIKGAKGIGEKTATDLIKSYKSIKNLFNNIDSIKDRYKKILLEYKEVILKNLEIVEIHKELNIEIDDKNSEIISLKIQDFSKFLGKYEFKSLLSQLNKLDINVPTQNEDIKKERFEFHKVKNLNETFLTCFLPFEDAFFCFNEDYEYMFCTQIPNNSISFDIKKLYKENKLQNLNVGDLQVYSYCFNPEFGDSNLQLIYKKIFHKTLLDNYESISNEVNQNLLFDAFAFVQILKKVNTNIGEKEIWIYKNIDLPLIETIAEIEKVGFKVNTKYLQRLELLFSKKIDEIKKDLFQIVGHEFNPNSPKELSKILFDELNLPKVKKIKTGFSTNERTISKLAGVHPIINKILDYREYTKLQNTYVIGLQKLIFDDRIHTELRQTTVATGRLSSINPNLQNIPTRSETGELIRKAFIADEGYILLSLDYSQIELRLMAEISGDEDFIQAFKDGKDIHTNTASLMFGVREEDVTSEQRRIAKMINFGIIYGISDFGLSDRLGEGIDVKTAKSFISKYFERYPKVKLYFDKIKLDVANNGYVETIFGRRRYFNLEAGNYMVKQAMYREAINMPIQGADADIVKLAMIKIQKLINDKYKDKVKMLLQIHDELMFEIINEDKVKSTFISETQNIMEHIVDLKVPMIVNVKSGEDWGSMK